MLDPFTYAVRKIVEDHNIQNKEFLLMVSGGIDSMVLLEVFRNLKSWHPDFKFRVLHIHHGDNENKKYRDQAQAVVKKYCFEHKINFLTNSKPKEKLFSENDFRQYRQAYLQKIKTKDEIVVSAHHKMDQLESRLHHLIRGCGPEGLIAMKVFSANIFRPFLNLDKHSIIDYQKEHSIPFVEDETNKDTKYFRNWLRQKYLPQLESYQRGAVNSLANSLDNIAGQFLDQQSELMSWFEGTRLKRNFCLDLPQTKQLQVLSLFLRENSIYEYRRSHLEEVLKRLDKRRNSYTFVLLKRLWRVEKDHLILDKLDSSSR